MRYPLWAFFFVLVMPPFAAHALLTGQAGLSAPVSSTLAVSMGSPAGAAYWTHVVVTR